ncbi:MAG: winged helix-turn-helix domain-containing protein [Chloroflexi bacterium]|nr:winged helix-turn-helix domain-containing protein [Chloroflexota bacterium]
MPLAFANWTFAPSASRSDEENERWWQECYLPNPVESVLSSQAHWRLITGSMGSGRSVVLDALERHARQTALVLRYASSAWPGAQNVIKKDGNHLSQIMSLASLALQKILGDAPDKLDSLSTTQREFLRWLIEKFTGRRAYSRWLDGMSDDHAQMMRDVLFEDIYHTDTETLDIQGQIEELLGVSRRLGLQQVLIFSDVEHVLSQTQMENLEHLVTWLELMHHPGLTLIAALPAHLCDDKLRARTRGRVAIVPLQWTEEQSIEIANRHIRVSTNGAIQTIGELMTQRMSKRLAEIVDEEFEEPVPSAWVGLAQVLLQFASQYSLPLDVLHFDEVKREYFRKCLQLRPDPVPTHRGVWRGPKFIPLDVQPFRFLQTLCQTPGKAFDLEDPQLNDVAGSKGNVHTLARRIRKVIEPDPKQPIYLQNRRDEGYWVDGVKDS